MPQQYTVLALEAVAVFALEAVPAAAADLWQQKREMGDKAATAEEASACVKTRCKSRANVLACGKAK